MQQLGNTLVIFIIKLNQHFKEMPVLSLVYQNYVHQTEETNNLSKQDFPSGVLRLLSCLRVSQYKSPLLLNFILAFSAVSVFQCALHCYSDRLEASHCFATAIDQKHLTALLQRQTRSVSLLLDFQTFTFCLLLTSFLGQPSAYVKEDLGNLGSG